MAIISPLPNTFANGTTIDAGQMNANFAQVVANVNANAAGSGANDDITALDALTTPIPSTAGGMPTGAMLAFGGTVAPSGYLLCDGSAVSRATYATLFAVLGTAYGAGDGSTTFNVPDGRGRVMAGYDAGNATGRLTDSESGGVSAAALGNTGGEQAHTLVTAELAEHLHAVDDPGHTHNITDAGHAHTPQSGQFVALSGPTATVSTGTGVNQVAQSDTGTATTGITINSNTTGITETENTGSGNGHNTVQPTFIAAWIIKT